MILASHLYEKVREQVAGNDMEGDGERHPCE